ASATTSASQPPAPHDETETMPPTQAATGPRVRTTRTAPLAVQDGRRAAQSGGPTGLSWTRGLLSLLGGEQFEEHRSEWLIVGAVAMCVVVIILSGLRNVVLAGRQPTEDSSKRRPASAPRARPAATERDPQEISEILERLDAVIGRSEHAAGEVESDDVADPQSATETAVEQSAVDSGSA